MSLTETRREKAERIINAHGTLVTCAGCARDVVGKGSQLRVREMGASIYSHEIEEGRIYGRPYCGACLDVPHTVSGIGGGCYGPADEPGPAWENMIRAIES